MDLTILFFISELLFDSSIPQKIMNYSNFHLNNIKNNLHKFLTASNNEVKKKAFKNLTFYYETNNALEFKESPFQKIIFRIDEIGEIDKTNDYLSKDEIQYINIVNYHINMKFEFPFKFMRLYILRNYINDF
jgi:hypothetical protein